MTLFQQERVKQQRSKLKVNFHPSGWLLFAITWAVFAILAICFSSPPGMTMTNGDEPHYLLMAHSLLHDRDLDLRNNYDNKDFLAFYENEVLDEHILPFKGREVLAHEVVGLPILILLPYAVAGRIGVLVFLALLMAGGLAALYRAVQIFVPVNWAFGTVLFCGLTYPLVIYSHQIYPDPVAFGLVSFVLMQVFHPWPWDRNARLTALAVGVALGLLPHFHFRFALLASTLYIFFLFRERAGRWHRLRWSVGPPILLALTFVGWIRYIYGEFSLDVFTFRSNGFASRSNFGGILGLWFDQEHGLFFFAPIYLLSLVGAWYLWQNKQTRRDAGYLSFIYGASHLVSGSYYDWVGGFSPIPRYLIPVLPIGVLFLTVGLRELTARRQWIQVSGLALGSLWITYLILFVHRPFMFGFHVGTNTILREYYQAEGWMWLLPSFYSQPLIAAGLRLALVLTIFSGFWLAAGLISRLVQFPFKRLQRQPGQTV